jgi:hypothetical protein
MKRFKYFLATACDVLILMGATGLILPPSIYGTPPQIEDGDSPGQGDEHRADPCDHLPDPPGNANGIEKKCPPLGSSSGIAKGDFNGDGIGDLVIGVERETVPDSNGVSRTAGAVHIIYGSANRLTIGGGATGVPSDQLWHQDLSGILGDPENNDQFGAALAAGDFNGDNVSDLAIGVPGENGQGAIQVLFGSIPNGLTATGNQEFFAATFSIGCTSCQFGRSLAWGDFNGDGTGDLAVGQRGRVLILRGQAGVGLTTANFQTQQLPNFIPALTAGKFNSDGRSDLAVGIPDEGVLNPTTALNQDAAGTVRVFYGSSTGLNFTSTQLLNQFNLSASDGAEPFDRFGTALAAGDFNCDSISDLAIGVPFENLVDSVGNTLTDAGAVNVIYGSSNGLTVTGNQFWHQDSPNIEERAESGDRFGAALAAGNFDGFCGADLAIGVPFENFDDDVPTVSDSGAVNVIYGQSGSGLVANSIPLDQFFHQNTPGINDTAETGDRFGSTLTAWDFSGDGAADLAIGVPFEDVINASGINTQDAGQVQVLYGVPRSTTCCPLSVTPGGLTTTNDQIWHQDVPSILDSVAANDQFGSALY